MTALPARYTVERTSTPNSGFRFLGWTGTGHLAWGSIQLSTHFMTARDAAALIDRTGVADATVIRHAIH